VVSGRDALLLRGNAYPSPHSVGWGRQRIDAGFIEVHRGFDVLDMHVQALLDGFGLTAHQVAARYQFETLAFQFLDRKIDAVTRAASWITFSRSSRSSTSGCTILSEALALAVILDLHVFDVSSGAPLLAAPPNSEKS
jgi:hypothetical protein